MKDTDSERRPKPNGSYTTTYSLQPILCASCASPCGKPLMRLAEALAGRTGYARTPDPAGIARFVIFIRTCPATDKVTSAVPGTSATNAIPTPVLPGGRRTAGWLPLPPAGNRVEL